MSDNITLPREVAEKIFDAFSSEVYPPAASIEWCDIMDALRTALAAPRPEPVAFDFQKALRRAFNLGQNYWDAADSDSRAAHKRADKYRQDFDALCADALAYAAPPAAAPEKRHPGYIIGNHWLETAYERLCAGETEDAILEDYDLVREPRLRELRRDADNERLRGLLLRIRAWDHLDGAEDGSFWKREIDAAMEPATEPAIGALKEVPR